MFILQHKLKRLKIELREWNKNSYGNVHNAVLLKQGLLLGIQQVCLIFMGLSVKKTLLRRSLIMLFTVHICFGKKGLRCYGLKMGIEIHLFP